MRQKTVDHTRQIADAFSGIVKYLLSSFFRFLIILGVVFHVLGAFWATGTEAGHLLIYGSTMLFVGILGRLFVWWKIQNEY